MAPAHSSASTCAWRETFSHMCSAFKYACCEPCSEHLEDLYDDDESSSHGGDGDLDAHAIHVNSEHLQVPNPISSFDSSQKVARAVETGKDRDRRRLVERRTEERGLSDVEEEHVYGDLADSPGTHVTKMDTLTLDDFYVTDEEKTPISDAGKGSRDRLGGMPPTPSTNQSRWSDEMLEGFLYSTLVHGSGLVLVKLGSDGKGKKSGERILSYDPDAMRLDWISTGMRRKPGSMLVKDIDEVLCEGTSVTIVYSQPTSTAGTRRMMSLSPMRRSSVSIRQMGHGRRRKVFQTSKKRDASILTELLLFVRRKALVAFSVAVTKLAASANASSGSSAIGFGDADASDNDNHSDSDDGGVVAAVAKSHSFGGGGARLGGTGRLGRSERRSVL